MSKIFVIALAVAVFLGAEAHVRLMMPASRSSLWRLPEFEPLNPPVNYDDDALYCGRVHQWPEATNCGVCGDPETDSVPRDNENGGKFGVGIITGNYTAGQVIEISLDFTTTHLGHVEFHLCDGLPETDDCFKSNILVLNEGSVEVPIEENGAVVSKTILAQLPQGVTCDHCILRLNYRAGNNWGDCRNGTEGMGCGLQETFRHCSDISIR